MVYLKSLEERLVPGKTSARVNCFTLEMKLDFSTLACNRVSPFNRAEVKHLPREFILRDDLENMLSDNKNKKQKMIRIWLSGEVSFLDVLEERKETLLLQLKCKYYVV